MTKGAIRRALFAATHRKNFDDGGPVYDPMGGVAIPPSGGTEAPGLIDEAMERVAKAGATIGAPLRNIAQRYTEDTRNAAEDAMRFAVESGQKSGQALRENRPAEAVGQATWQALGNLGVPFAPLTGAAKTAGHYASYLTGNPGFGERVEFVGGFADPSHVGMIKAMAPLAGVSRPAIQTAKEVMTAQRELSPLGLYSHGAETSMGLSQAKGTPEQMAGMLTNQGVKPAELEGFMETFAGRPFVTREEVANFFSQNMPNIKETVIKTPTGYPFKDWDDWRAQVYEADKAGDTEKSRKLRDLWTKYEEERGPVAPRFEEYSTPGGTNYREVILNADIPGMRPATALEKRRGYATNSQGQTASVNSEGMVQDIDSFYQSPHWPNQVNPIAHMRLKDRYSMPENISLFDIEKKIQTVIPDHDPKFWGAGAAELAVSKNAITPEEAATYSRSRNWNNKYQAEKGLETKDLHVDEMQSDWAQKARALREDKIKELVFKGMSKEDAQKAVPKDYGFKLAPDETREFISQQLKDINEKIFQYNEDLKTGSRLYDMFNANHIENGHGPLPREKFDEIVKNIPEDKLAEAFMINDPNFFALKQQQENLYYKLNSYSPRETVPYNSYVANTDAWTDLALKRILREAAEGGYNRVIFTPGATQARRYNLSNHVDEIRYSKNDDGTFNVVPFKDGEALHQVEREALSEKELAGLYGQGIAQKMKNYEGEQSGNVLSLSGQDLMVGGEGMVGYYDRIVPKRVPELLRQIGHKTKLESDFIKSHGDEWPYTINVASDGKKYWLEGQSPHVETSDNVRLSHNFPSFEAADKARNRFYEGYNEPAHVLTLTPEMNEAILKGFPHFASGGAVGKRPFIPVPNKYKPIVDRALMLTSKKA